LYNCTAPHPYTEEAWRAAPTVLETGLDALEEFDAWGLPRSGGGGGSGKGGGDSSTTAGASGSAAAGAAGVDSASAPKKGQEEQKEEAEQGSEGDGRAKKRQRTMADVVVSELGD
jgi:hypothetical protein